MSEKACRSCKRLVKGKECPVCKDSKLSTSWKGVVIINDPNSEIAQTLNISVPGKYCLSVR